MRLRIVPCVDASGVFYIIQDKHWLFGWRDIGRHLSLKDVFHNPLIFNSTDDAVQWVRDNFDSEAKIVTSYLRC